MRSLITCPVCQSGRSLPHAIIDGYGYFTCQSCDSIHIDPAVLDELDAGNALVGKYEKDYWERERKSALARATGVSLCRAGEAILYCRRPVKRLLDLGAGPGFLVQELQRLIDPTADIVHGVEKYPPPYASVCTNLHIGSIASLAGLFDAGICIEVIEHLTPRMLDAILGELAGVSAQGSLWLFNTGMPDYVRNEDPGYLDPVRRGHIISYSLAGLTPWFEHRGFRISALPGRSFGFFAEYQPQETLDFASRFYQPVTENLVLLQRNGLLYQAAFETARSYYYQAQSLERTRWAQALSAQLQRH